MEVTAGALLHWSGRSGLDFSEVQSWAFFIEIALSIYALCLRSTFTLQKASQKLGAELCAVHPTLQNRPLIRECAEKNENLKSNLFLTGFVHWPVNY